MLPLRDHNPSRRTPVVTYLLIAANLLMFFWELRLGSRIEEVLFRVAFIPARFWVPEYIVPNVVTIFVSMFLHGGFLHIASNLWYLWIFGDNIEDRLGHGRYLAFYLTCGVGATLAHAFFNPNSQVPAIGASGAIAGVLGAYLVLYPLHRVTTVIPIVIFILIRQIPAVILLGFWILLQVLSGFGTLGMPNADISGGVAYFAHIGGFVIGMVLILVMSPRRPRRAPAG